MSQGSALYEASPSGDGDDDYAEDQDTFLTGIDDQDGMATTLPSAQEKAALYDINPYKDASDFAHEHDRYDAEYDSVGGIAGGPGAGVVEYEGEVDTFGNRQNTDANSKMRNNNQANYYAGRGGPAQSGQGYLSEYSQDGYYGAVDAGSGGELVDDRDAGGVNGGGNMNINSNGNGSGGAMMESGGAGEGGEERLSLEQLIAQVERIMWEYERSAQYIDAERARQHLESLKKRKNEFNRRELQATQQEDVKMFFAMVLQHQRNFDQMWALKMLEYRARADDLIDAYVEAWPHYRDGNNNCDDDNSDGHILLVVPLLIDERVFSLVLLVWVPSLVLTVSVSVFIMFFIFTSPFHRLKEKHDEQQQKLYHQLRNKRIPKFSVELLNHRKRQVLLAKAKKFTQAEVIKRKADVLEAIEIDKIRRAAKQDNRMRFEALLKQQQWDRQMLVDKLKLEKTALLEAKAHDFQRLKNRLKNAEQALRKSHTRQGLLAERRLPMTHSTLRRPGPGSATGAAGGAAGVAGKGKPGQSHAITPASLTNPHGKPSATEIARSRHQQQQQQSILAASSTSSSAGQQPLVPPAQLPGLQSPRGSASSISSATSSSSSSMSSAAASSAGASASNGSLAGGSGSSGSGNSGLSSQLSLSSSSPSSSSLSSSLSTSSGGNNNNGVLLQ